MNTYYGAHVPECIQGAHRFVRSARFIPTVNTVPVAAYEERVPHSTAKAYNAQVHASLLVHIAETEPYSGRVRHPASFTTGLIVRC